MKLERLLAKYQHMGRSRARESILANRVRVDDLPTTRFDQEVDRFARVTFDDKIVQLAARRLRIILHKPVGVISATKDKKHRTVIDLIDDPDKDSLHLVGRLDINTSGLVLLTNDGRWSKALMHPDHKVAKVYHVTAKQPIPADAPDQFRAGFYFKTEDITTLPAELEILTPHTARVTLHEGRYRQVRRMFHRVGCKVTALHRESVGDINLPANLTPESWQILGPETA
ncbi:pseudouridine synthase [Opitutaceae bacterium]|nr:pseudouridine synthase [Opitutaceae bacterium]